ncbi:SGNH/GDSL hydrolase family protein [Geodermatophilus sp. SYSU D01119]
MSRTPRHTRPTTAAAVVAAAALSLAGCTSGDGGDTPPSPPADAVRLAAVGDSITQADGDVPAGVLGRESWLSTAATDGVVFAGGWARPGATTADMLAAAGPVDADVLVVLAGTNDPGAGLTEAETADNVRGIVEAVGVERVVLSAVPPRDEAPAVAVATNAALEVLAEEEGWTFADSAAGVRSGDRFAPGMATDGLHPSEEGAAVIGAALREAVLEAAGA